jgi:hypothetical protein
MTCPNCGKRYPNHAGKCPQCGRTSDSGLFQTSTVLISAGDVEGVYRSVQEVPEPLRNRLLRSTNGANSATILIADRKGREEIARVMRQTPAPRGLAGFLVSRDAAGSAVRLTLWGKSAVAVLLAVLLAGLLRLVFAR